MIKGLFTERERVFLKTVRMSIVVSTESGVGGVGSGLLIFAVSAGHYLRSLVNKMIVIHPTCAHSPIWRKDEITYRFFAM